MLGEYIGILEIHLETILISFQVVDDNVVWGRWFIFVTVGVNVGLVDVYHDYRTNIQNT
jgi:hypothetical protein